MHRRVHREHHREYGEADRDACEWGQMELESRKDCQRQQQQGKGPVAGYHTVHRFTAAKQAKQAGHGSLDDAVADHPKREKATHLGEGQAQSGQKDGQADYEPDIAGGKQKETSKRQPIDGRRFGQQAGELDRLFGLAERPAQGERRANQYQPTRAAAMT